MSGTGRRTVVGMLAAGAAVAALASATPASAAGGLPSGTTLTVSPSSVPYGTPVTLSATVKVLGLNGLGITPTGSIIFTASNSAGSVAPLGSAPISSCLLTACTATLTTAAAPIGTVSATATYPGDNVVGPSAGSAPLSVGQPTAGGSSTVVCYPSQPCDTGNVQSSDNKTNLDVQTPGSSGFQTLSGSLDGGALHCIEPPDNEDSPRNNPDADDVYLGALATFSSSANDVTKTITYKGFGTVAANMAANVKDHPTHAGCYGSPNPFKGFRNGQYTDAAFNATDGLYEAVLATCDYTKKATGSKTPILPCNTPSGTTSAYTYTVTAPAGDPKFIG